MAHAATTDKGFKVIYASNIDVIGIGGFGICDRCDTSSARGVIIPVLAGRWYCETCFENWHKEAERFEENTEYEESTLKRFEKLLKLQ